ncbi:DNA polymerase III subunit gamma/tau [Solemya velesiana gill symbiont]|uniref:DNA polymerase III subunit gamma/tau n=1 Tax=Solemya velesiana gill symbiont TaxID=1918948 RepID=A0A1T2KS68_9GAMM|nr:DNA polymerase III subunit gamma/tau [Solemya velesiana gill symbiont]OOZ35703.1 DNA polymerase III subunit gamma/tau [Solemya velesiana gill symbiont]
MSYQVLARKWRPRIFSELVGQEHVVRALSNALDNDRLHHAYLFTGTRGVGKTTLARIFAKSLNCEHGVGSTPCGQCSTCREIDEGRFVDLLEVDAASRTKVDQTRELLENVPYAPVRGRYKVYLIDEVHMFSDSSFNALLKTLEEPPPHVKFLLATTDPQKVPVTVLSRCLQFNLKRLPLEQIQGHLQHILEKEGIEHEVPALVLLSRSADGSMRDALSLMDQSIAFGGGQVMEAEVRAMLGAIAQDRVHDLLYALADFDADRVMALVHELAEMVPDFSGALQDLLALLHRVALAQVVPDALDNSAGDEQQVRDLAGRLSAEDVQLFYQIGLMGQRDLPLAPDPRAGFEMVLLRMLAFRPADSGGAVAESTRPKPQAKAEPARPAPQQRRPVPAAPAKVQATVESPPAVGEEAPAPAPAVRTGNVDLSDWMQVVEAMSLGGVAKQLANNCTFESWDGSNLKLKLDPTHQHMKVGTSEQRLIKALSDYLNTPVKLSIDVAASETATPAQLQAKAKADRQRDAETVMTEDPLVQAMEEQLGARLIPESIRPVEE